MKQFVVIFLASILSCGFLIQTPAERKEIERRARKWRSIISVRYDLDALTQFLQATVATKKSWDGVDLTKPRIGAKWDFRSCCMNSGDWSFTADDPKKDEFMLRFSHSNMKRTFALRCVREGVKSFRVIEGLDEEVVELLL